MIRNIFLTLYRIYSQSSKCEKWSWESHFRNSAEKYTPMYLLVAGNDTVPISIRRAACMRCTQCCVVYIELLPTVQLAY